MTAHFEMIHFSFKSISRDRTIDLPHNRLKCRTNASLCGSSIFLLHRRPNHKQLQDHNDTRHTKMINNMSSTFQLC